MIRALGSTPQVKGARARTDKRRLRVHERKIESSPLPEQIEHYRVYEIYGTLHSAVLFLYFSTVGSDWQQPAPDRDGDRVSAVVGAQLVDQVLDVKVHRRFGDPKAVGNLLVAMTVANQT